MITYSMIGSVSIRSGIPVLCVLSLMAIFSPGCNGKLPEQRAPSAPEGQETPMSTLRKYHSAILQNSVTAYLECCAPKSAEWQQALRSHFAMMRCGLRFKRAFLDAYGKGAWDQYQAPREAGTVIVNVIPTDDRWESQVHLDIRGNEAACDSGRLAIRRLIMEDGVWYCSIDYPNEGVSAAEHEREWRGFRKAIEALTIGVNNGGVRPEDLSGLLQEEMWKQLPYLRGERGR